MSKKLLFSSAGVLISSLSLMFATPARADFVVCNRAQSKAFVAVAWTDRQGTQWSRGWSQLDPGACNSAITGRVSNTEIGVYAETLTGVVETGDTPRCVIWVHVQPSWNIRNADNRTRCQGKGREMKGFTTIETGSSPDYTYEVYD